MFPSTNTSQTFTYNPNPNPNPIVEQEVPPLMFSHFPSPFLDVTDFLSPQQECIFNTTTVENANIVPPKLSVLNSSSPPQKKMRKSRKDRHSKISTAQGVRARRVRLPRQIARRFFDLQDMLGFDKASKTIEWLLAKSKGAIKELTRNIPSSINGEGKCGLFSGSSECKKNKRDLGMAMKSSRDMARARARERTREKMRMRSIEKMAKLGSSSSNPNSSIFDSTRSDTHQSLNKQFSNVGIGIDGKLSNSIFDYEKIIDGVLGGIDCSNNLMDFIENWDAENEMFGY